jgi:hypothetical protein
MMLVGHMKTLPVLIACALCWFAVKAAAEAPLYVGVLENVEAVNLSPAMSTIHVRVAFQKNGADWIPMKGTFGTPEALSRADSYFPASVNWTIVFSGKSIGTIDSKNPGPPMGYGDVGTQSITTKPADIPLIKTGATDFYYGDSKVHTRPLILVSVPNFKDPDGWKPTTLTLAEKQLVVKNFRKKFPKMEQCKEPEEEPTYMVPYGDDEILLLKAYRSRSGEVLYGQRLDGKRSMCGFFDDETFFDYWFVLSADQRIKLLDSQMTPMDAADLDNTGKSAWVFHTSRGEDWDGYELFYDDFTKRATFQWSYH